MRFQLSDVFLPSPEELRAAFPDTEELEGTVIAFSDSGNQIDAFAVVEVVQKRTLVVPVEKLEMAGGGEAKLGLNPKDSASEAKSKTE